MRILIRADASSLIGHGHVMRCLTIASEMQTRGVEVLFACQELPGNARKLISTTGTEAFYFSLGKDVPIEYEKEWHSDLQKMDADAILGCVGDSFDAVIVDHYGLGSVWENKFRSKKTKLVVIDDLANRSHSCDYLIDSGAGRLYSDYRPYLTCSNFAKVMLGPQYALLRNEFKEHRQGTCVQKSKLKKVMLSMGGGEQENIALHVLESLVDSGMLSKFNIGLIVVLPVGSPWGEEISKKLSKMQVKSELFIGTNRMAELMTECYAGIGSGGLTALERCCVGLPSVVIIRSENQRAGAKALEDLGAALAIDYVNDGLELMPVKFARIMQEAINQKVRNKGQELVDGLGASRVADMITEK